MIGLWAQCGRGYRVSENSKLGGSTLEGAFDGDLFVCARRDGYVVG